MKSVKVKLAYGATIPKRMTSGSVGYDLCALTNEILLAGQTKTIETGISFEIPDGYEIQIRPRSGLSVKYDVIQILGTIDSDYRGEIKIILKNIGTETFLVGAGERIAQAVFNKVELPELEIVNNLNETKRGSGGFGSTGIVSEQAKEIERLVRQVMKSD